MQTDGSFDITVEQTAWGDISLTLQHHDLRIDLDPGEAARVCREVWTALDHYHPAGPAYAVQDGRAAQNA